MSNFGANDLDRAVADETDGAPIGTEVPFHFSFSTRDIPSAGKFETWRDLWMRQLVEIEISTDSPETFEGDMELWGAGPLSIARLAATRALYERTASLADNGNNDFSFGLYDNVRGHIGLRDGITRLGPRGAFLLAHDRSYAVAPADDFYSFCLLRLDRAALLELLPRNLELGLRTFAARGPTLRLIKNMIPLITNRTEPTTPQMREAIGRQIIDLVALLLNPSRDGRALIERRGLKAARLGALLQIIDERFADPSLSAESVARELHISARHVHRLLEETTKTFYEHLLERRLAAAHTLLADPTCIEAKIGDIAFQAGFTNATYFSQAFRRRFGDTPTGVRVTATTRRALRFLQESIARTA